MAIWKELTKADPLGDHQESHAENLQSSQNVTRPKESSTHQTLKDSIIGAGLTVEGKIEGDGNVRIAGQFKGDVRVKGNLAIESGAHISAEISADTVTVGGEVEGNINATTRVELLASGQLIGDLKAKSLTVAAGSRMRGRVEFGWDEHEARKIESKKAVDKVETRSVA